MGNTKYLFNLLLIAVALVLLYFGYHFLTAPKVDPNATANTSGELGLVSAGFSNEAGQSISDEFLQTLNGLQELTLNGDIFNDPVFRDLRDTNTILKDQAPGRPNPFAPINFDTFRPRYLDSGTTTPSRGGSSPQNTLDQLRAR